MARRYPDLIVADMLDALEAIESFTQGLSPHELMASRLHKDAIIRNLEVLGEAANQLPKPCQGLAPDIPWPRLISLRNRLIHEYHGVSWDILLPTILTQLGELKEQLTYLLACLPQERD